MEKPTPKTAILLDGSLRPVCVQPTTKPKDSHQLVAEDIQGDDENASKVMVYNIMCGSTQCMAFGFKVKEKNVFPVVTHDQGFKVLDVKDKKIDKTFLFQWGETLGNWRTLKSVAEPEKYLHVDEESGKVSITEQRDSFFCIKYTKQEKAHAANRNAIVGMYESCKIQENEMNICKGISRQKRRLKRRPSCCGSVASHKPLCCKDRKNKRMKM